MFISICLNELNYKHFIVSAIISLILGLKLEELGYEMDYVDNGRPAYHPADLLKLYIYGYMNRIRSSRQLEKECHRNLEVIWLLKNLKPDHNTISNFRRDNPDAIKRASSDVGLIFIAYNLRRILNIIGIEAFRRYLLAFFTVLGSIMGSLERFWRGRKNLHPFYPQNFTYHRMEILPIFGGQYCSKTKNFRGY